MADQDSGGPDFNRPWEDADSEGSDLEAAQEETAEVVQLPGMSDESDPGDTDVHALETADEGRDEASESAAHPDDVDWEAMAGKSDPQDFTSEEYVAATTQEYQGLAEEVSRASEEYWEMQAVAATVPGVESGLVGFDDVSGGEAISEEAMEGVEQAATSDLAMRVASALVIFGMFLGSLLLGGWWFSAFVILVMVVAVGEFYANMRAIGYRPLALFGLIAVVLVGIGTHNWGVNAIAGWVGAMTAITLLFFSLTPRNNPLGNTSVTILGFAWVSMLAFAIPFGSGPHPVAYVLFIVLLVALNDIGAYFVGRTFGKRKLAPQVSPKKTVEGFVGGLIVGAVAASILATFPAWETIGIAKALVAAGVVGLISPIGDLCQSMVKRSIGVKDMGSVLPGHGGMLDRVDGFLFVLPALYFLFRGFGLL